MRRKLFRPTFEQLERRELFAVVVPIFGSQSEEFVGPWPLDTIRYVEIETTLPTTTIPISPPPIAIPEEDPFARYGFGGITAQVIDGVLTIRGDEKKNHVTLFAYDNGEYGTAGPTIVLGAGWAAKVNGTYLHTQELIDRHSFFHGVTSIDIDLGDGDDMVEVHAIKIPSLTIHTGNGEDWVNLKGSMPAPMYVTGHYNPNPGMQGPQGNWNSKPQPLRIEGNLLIDTGTGNDRLMPFATVQGEATVQMGTGDDSYVEIPYHYITQLSELPVVIDGVSWYRGPEYISGKLTATGDLTVELGADQETEIIPDDWRSDQMLQMYFSGAGKVLEHYRGMIERGEHTPGIAQIFTPPYPNNVESRVDAEGRLEVEFGFTPGFARVIERLQARGVVLEAYSINRGRARVLLGVDDLKLFANLPGLGFGSGLTYLYEKMIASSLQIDAEWDYVRPGTTTAHLPAPELPPRPPVTESPFKPFINIPVDHDIPSKPTLGPIRIEDAKTCADGDFGSLDESYYGSDVFGPQQLP